MPDENVTAGMLQDESRELWDVLKKLHELPREAVVPLPPMSEAEMKTGAIDKMEAVEEREGINFILRSPRDCRLRGRISCFIGLSDILDMVDFDSNA